ncbi:competence protein CoiA [Reyranella massiliensis]|uniref:competence protein CoiA n=1 Tax=Reyranella massiliensis TaxID=445220 RepID=UPI0011D1B3C3|nr:competence protein CoiA family protein [Reyranella massiliensis]
MKFAAVEGCRQEAQPGLSATCPVCREAVVAKCGPQRVWHWAHRGTRNCDHWWEPETPWHRAWKDHFPKHWQEHVHTSQSGEKHIADVKTDAGLALEFQNSFLKQQERLSRDAFYSNLVWVINARRRTLDRARFFAAINAGTIIHPKPLLISVPSNRSALLRDWEGGVAPVYFDFGNNEPEDGFRSDEPLLWRLDPHRLGAQALLFPMNKTLFLQAHLIGEPLEATSAQFVIDAAAHYSHTTRSSMPSLSQRHHLRRRF